MFHDDIFQKNAQIAVYFPGKETFIYKTLNWLLFISLVFFDYRFSHFCSKYLFYPEAKENLRNEVGFYQQHDPRI